MKYEEMFEGLTVGIWNLTWLLGGEAAMSPPPPRSQVKFQMPTVSPSNISSYVIILVKVLFWIY